MTMGHDPCSFPMDSAYVTGSSSLAFATQSTCNPLNPLTFAHRTQQSNSHKINADYCYSLTHTHTLFQTCSLPLSYTPRKIQCPNKITFLLLDCPPQFKTIIDPVQVCQVINLPCNFQWKLPCILLRFHVTTLKRYFYVLEKSYLDVNIIMKSYAMQGRRRVLLAGWV